MSHPTYRKIFWNVKDAFFGSRFLVTFPPNFLYFPVLAGIPLYTISLLQSGKT